MRFTEYLKYTNSSRIITESSLETVQPKNKDELVRILQNYFDIEEPDWKCDLNWIDTSKITDMSNLFSHGLESSGGLGLGRFNGDISGWDVSNVKSMECMFMNSYFNGDISKLNTSKVENMESMFANSKFNGDISKWDVSNVETMRSMFEDSVFNRDISRWTPKSLDTLIVCLQNLSSTEIFQIFGTIVEDMFKFSPLEDKEEFWPEKV